MSEKQTTHEVRKPDRVEGEAVRVADDCNIKGLRGEIGTVTKVEDAWLDTWLDGYGPKWVVYVQFFGRWTVVFNPESLEKLT